MARPHRCNAKLTEPQVLLARKLNALRAVLPTTQELARTFGVTERNLHKVITERGRWTHVRWVEPKDMDAVLRMVIPEIEEVLLK